MGAEGPEGAGRGKVVEGDGEDAVVVGHVDAEPAEEELNQRLQLQVCAGGGQVGVVSKSRRWEPVALGMKILQT